VGGLKGPNMTTMTETEKSNGTTETAAIVRSADEPGRAISAFSSEAAFVASQRIAKALASSSLVPEAYRGNIPNVLIAMELANRIGCSVFAAMQNLDIIHGRPSWRSQFLIATVNGSGRFTPIRFQWEGKPGSDDWGCRAVAKDRENGQECIGSLITIALAKAEGWYQKSGSKWKTMPEQMLMYRSASFWQRIYCPELSLGMQTADEVIDTIGQVVPEVSVPASVMPGSTSALEAALLSDGPVEFVNDETGEVTTTREPGED
jgi:hypothetical protein